MSKQSTAGHVILCQRQYVADAVMHYIRSGYLPSNSDATLLNRRPLIDFLRGRVVEDDVENLLSIVEAEQGGRAALSAGLLHSFCGKSEVSYRLKDRWETASIYLRCHLIWRILDDPDLSQDWHRQLFDFVIANWDEFAQANRSFYGSPEEIVPRTLHRIGDSHFPTSKQWAYLCSVVTAPDKQAARGALEVGLRSTHTFTCEVANTLLIRFFSSPCDSNPSENRDS